MNFMSPVFLGLRVLSFLSLILKHEVYCRSNLLLTHHHSLLVSPSSFSPSTDEPLFSISREPGFGFPITEGMTVMLRCEIGTYKFQRTSVYTERQRKSPSPTDKRIWREDSPFTFFRFIHVFDIGGTKETQEPTFLFFAFLLFSPLVCLSRKRALKLTHKFSIRHRKSLATLCLFLSIISL